MTERSRSIVVGLSGGLGNQMFQYAAGRSLAQRLGTTLTLDLSWFGGQADRQFALSSFRIIADVQTSWHGLPPRGRALASRLSRRWLPQIMGVPVLREPHFHYSSSFTAVSQPVFLEGYWQSERYFQEIRSKLLEEFSLKMLLPPISQALLEEIRDCDAVCVHVRRGDYLSNAVAARLHGTCSVDYYRRGVTELSEGVKNPHCFVFSDDPEWVRTSLNFDCPMTLVDVNGSQDAHLDLVLMSACRDFLIANSSLSWWAAWLCNRSEKRIIAPKQWFLSPEKNTKDLLPAGWLRR